MPPDVQIAIPQTDDKGTETGKNFEMGVYDTTGIRNPELVHFILEGQIREESTTNNGKFEDDENTGGIQMNLVKIY